MKPSGPDPGTGGGIAAAARVAAGVAVVVLWPCGWMVWGALSLIGTLMANDAGQAGGGAHGTLILGMLGGQLLAGAAGIPLGLGFFWRGRRRVLLWTFGWLLLAGLILQALSVYSFFLALSPS